MRIIKKYWTKWKMIYYYNKSKRLKMMVLIFFINKAPQKMEDHHLLQNDVALHKQIIHMQLIHYLQNMMMAVHFLKNR